MDLPGKLPKRDWSREPRRALVPTEIVSALAQLSGWVLRGEGNGLMIARTFGFADYFETIAFVNAVAMVAHVHDHHPEMTVEFRRCTVAFNTHDVGGLSATDFECAAEIERIVAPRGPRP